MIALKSMLAALLMVVLTHVAAGAEEESKFFANASVQAANPKAFVLQPEADLFLRGMGQESLKLRDLLIQKIQAVPDLKSAIANWKNLTFEEQVPYLKQIFEFETSLSNLPKPDLIIDAEKIPGRAAYFEFDVDHPGPGRVYLNPQVLKTMDKFAALALLIHETRHSYQFQLALQQPAHPFSEFYRSAFTIQQQQGARSFCDFLTLNNEFEAFQFGNYIVGRLTDWKIDMPDMGTFASQYDESGKIKIDLLELAATAGDKSLLEKFNAAELEQCRILGVCK